MKELLAFFEMTGISLLPMLVLLLALFLMPEGLLFTLFHILLRLLVGFIILQVLKEVLDEFFASFFRLSSCLRSYETRRLT